ncbi:hypothetical protein Wxf_02548 [Wolbachia endosymbiont of Armadillidium vulgare]|nr:hypothetical protein Wxf_00447 [Wolbachia endosymbiont of Armadillidium vulgare]OJH33078.1 hypothetical protein Wxf_02548 [Wolbachia endosymbiont of Armadillidium vulgare]
MYSSEHVSVLNFCRMYVAKSFLYRGILCPEFQILDLYFIGACGFYKESLEKNKVLVASYLSEGIKIFLYL